ncbi:hypothetical protein [Paludibaculum fermentans]|uniref:hypothetical protein n=1 Tax=Paludibaculum fermentans TaxID=1473598 RepID=UPI003EC03650
MRNYPDKLKVLVDIFGDGVSRTLVVTTGVLRRLDEKHGIKFDGSSDERPLYSVVPQAIAESCIEKDVTIEDIEDLPVSDIERLALAFFQALCASASKDKADPNAQKDETASQ